MRRWFRIPDAALGAIAYLGDLVFGLAGSTRRWQDRSLARRFTRAYGCREGAVAGRRGREALSRFAG
jgi:hypothetical protein